MGEEEGFEARRKAIKKIIGKYKIKEKCPHCSTKQEKTKLEKPYNFYENEIRLSPIEVRARLEKIPKESINSELFFCSFKVIPGGGRHFNFFSSFYKVGNRDNKPRFKGGWFTTSGCGCSLERGVGFCHL